MSKIAPDGETDMVGRTIQCPRSTSNPPPPGEGDESNVTRMRDATPSQPPQTPSSSEQWREKRRQSQILIDQKFQRQYMSTLTLPSELNLLAVTAAADGGPGGDDNLLGLPHESDNSNIWLLDPDEVLDLAEQMRLELQPKICDRRWRVKVYKRCLLYGDALSWLMSYVRRLAASSSSLEAAGDPLSSSAATGAAADPGISGIGDDDLVPPQEGPLVKLLPLLAPGDDDEDGSTVENSSLLPGNDVEHLALNLGNQLIDAGYLAHVKRNHRFRYGRYGGGSAMTATTKKTTFSKEQQQLSSSLPTLYFRFDDERLDADLVQRKLQRRIEALELEFEERQMKPQKKGGGVGGTAPSSTPSDAAVQPSPLLTPLPLKPAISGMSHVSYASRGGHRHHRRPTSAATSPREEHQRRRRGVEEDKVDRLAVQVQHLQTNMTHLSDALLSTSNLLDESQCQLSALELGFVLCLGLWVVTLVLLLLPAAGLGEVGTAGAHGSGGSGAAPMDAPTTTLLHSVLSFFHCAFASQLSGWSVDDRSLMYGRCGILWIAFLIVSIVLWNGSCGRLFRRSDLKRRRRWYHDQTKLLRHLSNGSARGGGGVDIRSFIGARDSWAVGDDRMDTGDDEEGGGGRDVGTYNVVFDDDDETTRGDEFPTTITGRPSSSGLEDDDGDRGEVGNRRSSPSTTTTEVSITRRISAHLGQIGSSKLVVTGDSKIHPANNEERMVKDDKKVDAADDALLASTSANDEKALTVSRCTTLKTPDEWPHRPVMVCINHPAMSPASVPVYGDGPCPLGVPFAFETPLFRGMALIRIRNCPSDDVQSTDAYFGGRQRRLQTIVQGRFTKEMLVDDVLTGHEFSKPLRNLPPRWVLRAGTSLISKLAPGVQIDLFSDKPKMLSILAATSQSISADMPGNEPSIDSTEDIEEDCSVFGGEHFGSGGSSSAALPSSYRRKRIFSDPTVASKYAYETESVYTFDFYQHLLDVSTYSLDLGFAKLDVSRSLNGQPIQVLAKTRRNGEYLWNFQIWHEQLLKVAAERAGDDA